ncbi:MAG: hypothetical protein ACRCY8_17665, partial [Dermatophilaceae bacterium]
MTRSGERPASRTRRPERGSRRARVILVALLLVVGFAGAATAVDLNPLPCGAPDLPVASLPGDGLAASLDGG